ncbi:hypothetical protein [Mangrovibrevibacter kandeliae]|uniref:hypothetical protein n=1 Tax=Mangrovibrevibacter kandeliae TaxID=2968473 RepID=UPI0021182395|nr:MULTISPECIES: hypothetical protein [unclassified Aurantimonas]MCQ8781492.1 hypothetical protein [Aurantimonas sp. CSK15Z-1]MCW4114269.1 hypothetical protein [Aurantimonas sp. MSK8Z-1]
MTTSADVTLRPRSKSVLRVAFERYIEARQRQADAYVASRVAMWNADHFSGFDRSNHADGSSPIRR